MGKTRGNIIALIALIACCQTASAARHGAAVAGYSSYNADVERLAQAGEPAASPTSPPPASEGSHDPSPQAVTSPPNPTASAEVTKPAAKGPGCALRYMAAEIAGKLKGRKWKEFRQDECGPLNTQAVFPAAIAPKYSGTNPDKARTLTCADQFNANKTTNTNGGLKWIEPSGGYYSECVSRLKG